MDHTVTAGERERRAHERRHPDGLTWLSTARLRPGRDVAILDLSSGGALVEAGTRLLPGTRVVLQFFGPSVRLLVPGRVLRCQVAAIDPERGVRYRGALAFDRKLDLLGEADGRSGYGIPEGAATGCDEHGHELPSDRASGHA